MFRRALNRSLFVLGLLAFAVTAAISQTVKVADVNAALPEPVKKLYGRAGLTKGEITASTWFAGPANTSPGITRYFHGEVMEIRKVGDAVHIDLIGTMGTSDSREPSSLFLVFASGKVSMSGAFTLAPTSPLSGRMVINANAVSGTHVKARGRSVGSQRVVLIAR